MIRPKKKLVLETGQEFYGEGFGADTRSVCEIVFNTSVVGYQEIISDPSYAGQIVVMTNPLIGNYGITDEDFESRNCAIGGNRIVTTVAAAEPGDPDVTVESVSNVFLAIQNCADLLSGFFLKIFQHTDIIES